MPEWVITWVLPYALQAITPIIVALAKKAAAWFKVTMPGPVILVLAGAIAEGINQLTYAMVAWQLPPGVSGVVAVGIREFYSQLVAQQVGFEEKHVPVTEAPPKPKPVPGQLGGDL